MFSGYSYNLSIFRPPDFWVLALTRVTDPTPKALKRCQTKSKRLGWYLKESLTRDWSFYFGLSSHDQRAEMKEESGEVQGQAHSWVASDSRKR
ncbi:selenoprotein t [Plakobranchus ocellatus]|uniref:Selenoprotein t n=1 Tax=Plakobranchus ocellatus TaxID=259542 RepID=A0AAV3Z5C7_9GAST|nr:selenoprotein t [Plakobranchus ocellatus]